VQKTTEWNLADSALVSLRSSIPTLRELPFYADPPIELLFRQMRNGLIKEQFVASLEGGRYWGRCYGYIINAQDGLHRDLSPAFADVAGSFSSFSHDGLEQPLLPPVVEVKGTVGVVNTLFSHNFHHWLLDCVPKFGLLQAAGWDLGRIDFFILPKPLSRWHTEVLDRLSIPSAKVVGSTSRTHLRADKLLVPSFSEPSRQPELYNYTPEGIAFVRKLFLTEWENHKSLPKRIIVSREKANARRLLQSDLLSEMLAPLGFEKVLLENFSLADQAILFHSAKTIIMPTGGGLANLAFCQPDTQVVELFDPAYLPTFSFVLSQKLGLEYHALVGSNHTKANGHSDSGGGNDMHFSIQELAAYIRSILK
jgi:capsular polysaccharide biosynthesis protein